MIELGTALQQRVDSLRESLPIPLDSVDFTVNDPARLRTNMGRTFAYFARVESEVRNNVLEVQTIVPTALEGEGEDFLDVWLGQETAHGQLFDHLQQQLGLPSLVMPDYAPGLRFRTIGFFAEHLPAFEDIVYKLYVTRGAMHERLTAEGYRHMLQRLKALGETGLARTMIMPIQYQEAGHLKYYIEASQAISRQLRPWQQRLARLIAVRTYALVGATSPQSLAEFGHAADTLAGDQAEAFAQSIQSVAQDLLAEKAAPLPPFVAKALRESIDLAREQAATVGLDHAA